MNGTIPRLLRSTIPEIFAKILKYFGVDPKRSLDSKRSPHKGTPRIITIPKWDHIE